MDSDIAASEFRHVLDRMPVVLVMLDRDGRIRYINPTAKRVVEKTQLELGAILWDIAPAPLATALRADFERLLAGNTVMLLRNHFVRGRWYEFVAYPTGNEISLLGIDVTQRLEAEAARRQGEERLRMLLESVQDYAIILLDPGLRISSWNEGAKRVFEDSAQNVIGQEIAQLISPAEAERLRENLEAALARGHHEDQFLRRRKDGSQQYVNLFCYPLVDPLGQPGGFGVVVRDVTEHRRMLQALQSSEARLRLALEAAGLGIWEYEIETGELRADARALALHEFPADGQPLTRDDLLARVHADDRERIRRDQDRAIAGGTYESEYRVLGLRTQRWCESRGNAVLDETGKPARVVGVVRDVTERHRYDEFRQLFPGLIAHDLRSPLSTMRLASETLKGASLSAEHTRFPHMILAAVDQVTRMTDQLLDFTQAQFGGGFVFERELTDLADIANEATVAARLETPNLEIDISVDGDCAGVWDRSRILEVVANLLGNAIEHGSHAQPIEVTVHGDEDHVDLSVHNGGPPIPAELMPVLFEPFRRAGRAYRRLSHPKSFGLGLYIVHEIVIGHGGTIDVSSSSEAGTTFSVRLPRDDHATATFHESVSSGVMQS